MPPLRADRGGRVMFAEKRSDVTKAGELQHPVRCFGSGWRARAVSFPATEFTGDFYITVEIDDVVWFAVGDFSGHGLGAAVFTMMVREELEHSIDHLGETCLVELVARLDRVLQEEFPSNRFASLVVGKAAPDGRVSLVNAGHCLPLVFRASGEVEEIASGGPVVGIVPGASWRSTSFHLGEGDRLLVYTDGLLEARNEDDDEFGMERIARSALPMNECSTVSRLAKEVEQFANGRREDDLTIFLLAR